MTFRDQFLTEFDLEIPFIREHLVRIPEDKLGWKPHERSMTLGWLSAFLGMIWTWGTIAVERESFDAVAAGAAGPPSAPSTRPQIVELFDRNTAAARAAIARADEADFLKSWSLLANGATVVRQPRWLVLRTMVMSHAVHHRAQLGVYLRLLGVPVPAVYNDSADEKGGIFQPPTS